MSSFAEHLWAHIPTDLYYTCHTLAVILEALDIFLPHETLLPALAFWPRLLWLDSRDEIKFNQAHGEAR